VPDGALLLVSGPVLSFADLLALVRFALPRVSFYYTFDSKIFCSC